MGKHAQMKLHSHKWRALACKAPFTWMKLCAWMPSAYASEALRMSTSALHSHKCLHSHKWSFSRMKLHLCEWGHTPVCRSHKWGCTHARACHSHAPPAPGCAAKLDHCPNVLMLKNKGLFAMLENSKFLKAFFKRLLTELGKINPNILGQNTAFHCMQPEIFIPNWSTLNRGQNRIKLRTFSKIKLY